MSEPTAWISLPNINTSIVGEIWAKIEPTRNKPEQYTIILLIMNLRAINAEVGMITPKTYKKKSISIKQMLMKFEN